MSLQKMVALTATSALLWTAAPLWAAGHTHPDTGEILSDNQSFTYRLLDQFPTLDPQLNEETSGATVIRDLFEGLMSQDASGELVPGVATGFEANDDNTVYTFDLRAEANWSNGDPVTAEDFVYAWRRAVDPETASPYAWFVEMASIENAGAIIRGEMAPDTLGVEAVDDHTLRVTLSRSLPYFASMTTSATLFPVHPAIVEEFGSDWTKPGNMVSNGAYTLDELVLNEYHTRVKNPLYWDADSVIIEKVTGLIINDENQALTRYLAGELDRTEIPAGKYPDLQEEYPEEATSVPRLCSYYFAINLSESGNPALRDVRVRKALSYALDRDVIVERVLKGGQSPAYSFTHWATAGFDMPTIDYADWPQAERDAKAKALMEEAGVSDLSLKLIYNTSEAHKQIANVMSQMWKQKLGVQATLENMEWQTFLNVRANQNFDIARSGWCGDYNEASTFLDLLTTTHGSNDGKYSNERVDDLMELSRSSSDPNEIYSQVEQILATDMPVIPVYHYASVFMLKPDIKGWPYNNVQENWYAKSLYRVDSE